MIERELIMSIPHADAADVHPRGQHSSCEDRMEKHGFFASIEAAGFEYQICGRCGTVRISELR